MRIFIKSFLILVLIVSISMPALAQNNKALKKSDKIIFILGKKYYLHKVKRGQTLYALSNAYNVPIQDIITENSVLLKGGLKSGLELKIPFVEEETIVDNTQDDVSENEFIFHTVQPDETLYYLTKKYHVSKEDIVKYNPQIKNGSLTIGQLLKIPKKASLPGDFQSDYYYHTVKPGETLFSISQKYDVDIESIKRLNPETYDNALRINQVLKIAKNSFSKNETLLIDHNYVEDYKYFDKDPLYFEESGVTPCKNFKYNSLMSFKIALMLPLYLNDNSISVQQTGKFYKSSKNFFEMYQGMLLAAERMKKMGLSVEFFVYDTEGRKDKVQNILSKPELIDADLIIGPVYSKNFQLASDFAKQHRINIVSPVPLSSNIIVRSNPFVFMANPSVESKVAILAKHLAGNYNHSIIVVHNGTLEEEKIINLFKDRLVKSYAAYEDVNEIVFKQINYKISGIDGVIDALSIGMENVILIPSGDEAFITDIVTRLNYKKDRYKITVYGMRSWENYRNIPVEYMANLNCHFGTTSHIDYQNIAVKSFLRQYRNVYAAEPGLYSFLGYDVANYFLNVLKRNGKHFQFCLPYNTKSTQKGLMFSFNFERVTPFSGFENYWLNIIKIDKDYRLTEVK
ncbi:MAG: LysM peptidoglycan-binding domain-containing protein [Bacteroidales bacterium]|nr:LysM peptidoglycan-binding domain-containing protein [Bacteroidales bacterium]